MALLKNENIKLCHSRENGNLVANHYVSTLDSCLRRNDINFMTKKKKIILIVVGTIVLILIIFGIWKKFSVKNNPKEQSAVAVEYKDPKSGNADAYSSWQTYDNKKYAFQMKYPVDWHVFADDAEADLTEQLLNGETIKQGGSVFFSNKDNIDYTQESKPADFHLLGLVVYEKSNTEIDDFARILGFTEATGTDNLVFQANKTTGKEYVSVGATDSEPRVAIIFKNNDTFYVFHLEFTGGDQEVLKNMENIVGTLQVGK